MLEFTTDLVIVAPPTKVLDAFFDPKALAAWWKAKQAVCVPRPLGSYAIEWEPTEWRDEILGRLGGALHATVMEFKPGREFFLADAYWLLRTAIRSGRWRSKSPAAATRGERSCICGSPATKKVHAGVGITK